VVHTDAQNLTYKNFNTECVMQWHLIIEEFGPAMDYIKGPKNIMANTLSHLKMTSNMEALDMADCYGLDSDDLPDDAFPVLYTLLDCKQGKRKIKLFLSEHKLQLMHTLLKSFMGVASLFAYCVLKTRLPYRQV
jgi:hypothetical protein